MHIQYMSSFCNDCRDHHALTKKKEGPTKEQLTKEMSAILRNLDPDLCRQSNHGVKVKIRRNVAVTWARVTGINASVEHPVSSSGRIYIYIYVYIYIS